MKHKSHVYSLTGSTGTNYMYGDVDSSGRLTSSWSPTLLMPYCTRAQYWAHTITNKNMFDTGFCRILATDRWSDFQIWKSIHKETTSHCLPLVQHLHTEWQTRVHSPFIQQHIQCSTAVGKILQKPLVLSLQSIPQVQHMSYGTCSN